MSGAAGGGDEKDIIQHFLSDPMTGKKKETKADHFVLKEKLGEGTYGIVYLAEDTRVPGKNVAIKYVRNLEEGGRMRLELERECKVLERLSTPGHPNVLQLLQILERKKHDCMFIVTPCYPDGDLYSNFGTLQQMKQKARIALITEWIEQLISALAYIHEKGVYHRDVHTRNVFVDRHRKRVVLGDFGLSRLVGNDPSDSGPLSGYGVFTVPYRSPEFLLNNNKYCPFKCDVWGLVVIFLEMLATRVFFRQEVIELLPAIGRVTSPPDGNTYAYTDIGTIFAIFRFLGTPDEVSWPGVTKLKNWSTVFPRFPQRKIEEHEQWGNDKLPAAVMAVLAKGLVVNPAQRGTAADLVEAFKAAASA